MNNITSGKHFQQGDVLIFVVSEIPAGAKNIKMKPVMEGEGHHQHVLDREVEGSEMFEKDGVLYLRLANKTPLRHESKTGGRGEHGTIVLEPGTYRVGQVHEWDSFKNEARKVVD